MSRRRAIEAKPRQPKRAEARDDRSTSPSSGAFSGWLPTSPAAFRETVESVIVAFVLAFLFRTFEAEAFVIPTGSMAPTLMGRHKDLYCPKCGYQYKVGASSEVEPKTQFRKIETGTCPMCRFSAPLDEKKDKSYSGDRILVGKFAYQLSEPERWDVVVFRYPGDSTMNYIKRLVGLPGEKIRIEHGDLWIQRPGEQEFTIARKPPEKLLAMLQPVFDNDLAPAISKYGWPARCSGWSSEDGVTFQTTAVAGESWLRYQHLTPTYDEWESVVKGLPAAPPKPRLISDFCAYNTGNGPTTNNHDQSWSNPLASGIGGRPPPGSLGIHWVGDLALDCTLEVQSAAGEAILELIKGGRQFQCRLDLESGTAALSISGPGAETFHPKAATAVRGPGKYKIIFSNVDDELRLWVAGRLVEFDSTTAYDSRKLNDAGELKTYRPRDEDLSPVAVGSRGAALAASHLRILRDVYYIADSEDQHPGQGGGRPDFLGAPPDFADPETWGAFDHMNKALFTLQAANPAMPGKDQFFMLGDNSAQSKDSRLWESTDKQGNREPYVMRELLIGKALFIYWPHSWDWPVPYFPNFQRFLHLIR